MGAGQSAAEMAERKRAQARKLEEEAKNWEQGSEGERHVGAILDRLPDDFVVFHDLQIPGSRANVDHLVIGPNGVVAVDTKKFSYPVTRGRGRGADRLWTGRRPVHMRSCKWEAAEVGRRIGMPVVPAMCIIAPSLPSHAFTFDGVRVCQPSHVVGEVSRHDAVVRDVALISERVAREFGASPQIRPAATAHQPSGAPRAAAQQNRPSNPSNDRLRNRIRLLLQPLTRLALIAGVTVGAMVLIPKIAELSGQASSAAADHLFQDLAPTTVPIAPASAPPEASIEAPPAVPIVLTCPNPGMGWTVAFGWPGPLPSAASEYSIRWKLNDGPIVRHDIGGWSDPAKAPVPMRIPNGADQLFITDYLGDDGEILASTESPLEVSDDC